MKLTIQDYGSFELFDKIIKAIIGDDIAEQTFIDLCCCEASATRNLPFKEKTYVDVSNAWVIPGQMDRFVQTNVLSDHEVFNKHYSVASCSDGIEHLIKSDGLKLVERMKTIADKQILFTPYGEYLVVNDDPHPNAHKSGWWPEDFPDFAVIVCPNWHPTLSNGKKLGVGGLWAWRCPDLQKEFLKVRKIIT